MDRSTAPRLQVALVSTVLLLLAGSGTRAHAQQGKMSPPAFQTLVTSKYGFDDTVAMLKGAIEGENLMVIQEIDPQKMLRMVGVQTKGSKQVFFFHPRYMQRLMDANPNATLEPPLKIAVMETPQNTVVVKYLKPSYLLGRYDGVADIGSELDTLVAKIVASVQR